eukprot:1194537-Prorocentrum_minimum.AAC.10
MLSTLTGCHHWGIEQVIEDANKALTEVVALKGQLASQMAPKPESKKGNDAQMMFHGTLISQFVVTISY